MPAGSEDTGTAGDFLLALWRRFRYNPLMGAVAARPEGSEAVQVLLSSGLRAAGPVGGPPVQSARADSSELIYVTSPEARATAAEILAAPGRDWFEQSVNAALDDPHLGVYGLMTTEDVLRRLFRRDSTGPVVRPEIEAILGRPDAARLRGRFPVFRFVAEGLQQMSAAAARRAGDPVSDSPDPQEPYGWLFDQDLPDELRSLFMDKAATGILVAVLDAAVQLRVSLPAWMSRCCVDMLLASGRQQLSAILGSPSVQLPDAAHKLGVAPLNFERVWARHAASEQGFRDLEAAARASGLPVYPPVEPDEDGT